MQTQRNCGLFAILMANSILIAFSGISQGIEINLTYSGVGFSEPGDMPPAEDPTGARLVGITRMAADYFESIIQDPGTFDINLQWHDRSDGFLAVAFRNIAGTRGISFDQDRDWFIDDDGPGATEHSEFDIGFLDNRQLIFQEAASTEQSSWFRGDVPGSLEYSLFGLSNGSDPDASSADFDLFTVALHELGHHLGQFGQGETADNFWDFVPESIGGRSVGMTVFSDASGFNRSHTAPPQSLMFPAVGSGLRRLPSTADILAIAGANNWTDLDLPRKEFLNGSDWHTAANWIGNRVPSASDDVYIRNTDSPVSTINLTQTTRAQNLHLGHRSWMRTGDNSLVIGPTTEGILLIDGDDQDTTLFVQSEGSVTAGSVLVDSSGTIEMQGGTLTATSGNIEIDMNGRLRGHGEAGLFGGQKLINKGTIEARNGNLRILGGNRSNAFDLDGDSGSTAMIVAEDGNIEFVAGGQAGGFDGTMTIQSRSVTFEQPFFLGNDGEINASGLLTSTLAAPEIISSGSINASGVFVIDGDVIHFVVQHDYDRKFPQPTVDHWKC